MKVTYLEYCKMILEKVSFDLRLFEKELKKAINGLLHTEWPELKRWCIAIFGTNFKYKRIISKCFQEAALANG